MLHSVLAGRPAFALNLADVLNSSSLTNAKHHWHCLCPTTRPWQVRSRWCHQAPHPGQPSWSFELCFYWRYYNNSIHHTTIVRSAGLLRCLFVTCTALPVGDPLGQAHLNDTAAKKLEVLPLMATQPGLSLLLGQLFSLQPRKPTSGMVLY